jgi:molecular chaperone GrpE
MFPKKKENPKEEQQEQPKVESSAQPKNMIERTSLESLYGLLDKLLPQSKQMLMEVLKKKEEHLKTIRDEEKDELRFAFTWEKEINGALKEWCSILLSQYLRVAADYDNYQKRSAKQTTEAVEHEKEKIIKALLPVMDDFERVLTNAENCENADAIIKGVGIVYEHLKGVLRSEGVEQIESTGEKFDPAHHQALTQRSEQDKEDGVILEELQKGYKISGRVIRASRVVVNKASKAETVQPTEEPETKDTQ